jgi:cell wall-associated NlpC family hydrolase
VKRFGDLVAAHEVTLAKAEKKQTALVAEITSQKNSIESQIASRRAYVKSVQKEIASLVAAQKRADELRAAQVRAAAAAHNNATDGATAPIIGNPPPGSPIGEQVVQYAEQKLGDRYVWGAAGPDTFDCSGLVVWAFAQVSIYLPHYTFDQMNMGIPVAESQLEPGDLVFFDGGNHVGIYVGNGNFIHAPHTGDVVKISSLSDSWYSSEFYTARRIGA